MHQYCSSYLFDPTCSCRHTQAFCSSITGTLATHAVLKGAGVGDSSASAIAATVTWMLKGWTCIHVYNIIWRVVGGVFCLVVVQMVPVCWEGYCLLGYKGEWLSVPSCSKHNTHCAYSTYSTYYLYYITYSTYHIRFI